MVSLDTYKEQADTEFKYIRYCEEFRKTLKNLEHINEAKGYRRRCRIKERVGESARNAIN